MEIIVNKRKVNIRTYQLIYSLAIFANILYLGMQLNYNTAFVDEAIYATIGEGVLRGITWENAISWMGGYYIYPLISAKINHYMGLSGIRLFAALCMVVTAIMAGKITKQFTSRMGEVVTVISFLFWANVMGVGQMGTYDAPSIAFLSISTYLALRSRYEKDENKKIVVLIFSSLFFALSLLTKYIAILFAPALILLVYNPKPFKRFLDLFNKKAVIEVFIWGLPLTVVVSVFVGIYYIELMNFFTGSIAFQATNLSEIIKHTWEDMGFILIGSLVGFIYALIFTKGDKRWLAMALFIGGMMPIMYHFGKLNIRSYWKHLVYAGFFLYPLFIWMIVKTFKNLRSFIGRSPMTVNLSQVFIALTAIAATGLLWSNLSQHWRFQRSWPSATPTLAYLDEVRDPDDKILAEASSVYKFHMFTGFEDPASWPSTWYMEYDGKVGTEAMIAGIEDKYFDLVILNDYFTTAVNAELRPHLDEHYQIVFVDDYQIEGVYTQSTYVWRPKDEVPELIQETI